VTIAQSLTEIVFLLILSNNIVIFSLMNVIVKVTGVPMSFLISRGKQIKVFSMILRKCRNVQLLVPTLRKTFSGGTDAGYEGATVLDPIKAYYEEPIATLDFASRYPSIMQACNLCSPPSLLLPMQGS